MRAKNRAVAVALAAAVLATATACDRERTSPPPSHIDRSAGVGTTPGEVTVRLADMDLRITGATVRLKPSGGGELTLRVTNGGGAPEHLDMIGLPDGSRAVLTGGTGVDGSLTTAGLLVRSGRTVTFGAPGGPTAALHGTVHGVTARHTLPLLLQFGVAGLVRLQAKVVNG